MNIVSLKRAAVKLAITADLVLLLAALGSLNIPTTITALLASIGQSKNAKRTALAHSFFNISGSIVFAFLIPVFAQFVTWISPKGPEVEVISRQTAAMASLCSAVSLPAAALALAQASFR